MFRFDEREVGEEPSEQLVENYSDLSDSVVTNSIMKKKHKEEINESDPDASKYLRKRVYFALDKDNE
jgi:hypothetical protein